jgi:hypothetical protein
MQDGLRRIYPRKEGKRTHKKVACCVLGGISRADLIKRGSGRWNEWQARTLLRCSRVDSQMLKLEEQSRAEQSRARTKHRQGRGVNRFKAHENEWVSRQCRQDPVPDQEAEVLGEGPEGRDVLSDPHETAISAPSGAITSH